ncbi:MAG: hypothetical protein RJQ09_20125 [Cyclobacteriaceae bacterium]
MLRITTLLTLLTIFSNISAQTPYFGLNKPSGLEIFAPSIVSAGFYERDIAISPDGTEVFYSIVESQQSAKIIQISFADGVWQPAKTASFSTGAYDIEPAFSFEGDKLYFASNRRESGIGTKDFDIWYVEKQTDGSWGDAVNVGEPINTEENEFYPSLAKNGTLYYTGRYASGKGGEDIWFSELVDGKYGPRQVLPTTINATQDDFNAFIDPDEQYIIWTSWGRDDDTGRGDLYISRKDGSGAWQQAENMTELNTPQLDYCPYVSREGDLLFFTSERKTTIQIDGDPLNPAAAMKAILSPQGANIYWVNFN